MDREEKFFTVLFALALLTITTLVAWSFIRPVEKVAPVWPAGARNCTAGIGAGAICTVEGVPNFCNHKTCTPLVRVPEEKGP